MTSPSEPDLLAVRRLAAEPTDESVTRSWYRITQLEATRVRPSRLRRLVPVTAAIVVALVAAGSLTIMRVGEGRFWPADSTPEAVAALNTLADAAATGAPITIGPDQVIRSESTGWGARFGVSGDLNVGVMQPQNRVTFYDPHLGGVVRHPDDAAKEASGPDTGSATSSKLFHPTLSWVAGLPTDPQQLLVALRQDIGVHDSWTVDHQLWDAIAHLYASFELALTPQQRAAFLRAAALMTGLTMRMADIDGQRLVAIQHKERDDGVDIYFDPYSGRAVGRGSIRARAGITIVYPTGGPAFEPGTAASQIWVQSSVVFGNPA